MPYLCSPQRVEATSWCPVKHVSPVTQTITTAATTASPHSTCGADTAAATTTTTTSTTTTTQSVLCATAAAAQSPTPRTRCGHDVDTRNATSTPAPSRRCGADTDDRDGDVHDTHRGQRHGGDASEAVDDAVCADGDGVTYTTARPPLTLEQAQQQQQQVAACGGNDDWWWWYNNNNNNTAAAAAAFAHGDDRHTMAMMYAPWSSMLPCATPQPFTIRDSETSRVYLLPSTATHMLLHRPVPPLLGNEDVCSDSNNDYHHDERGAYGDDDDGGVADGTCNDTRHYHHYHHYNDHHDYHHDYNNGNVAGDTSATQRHGEHDNDDDFVHAYHTTPSPQEQQQQQQQLSYYPCPPHDNSAALPPYANAAAATLPMWPCHMYTTSVVDDHVAAQQPYDARGDNNGYGYNVYDHNVYNNNNGDAAATNYTVGVQQARPHGSKVKPQRYLLTDDEWTRLLRMQGVCWRHDPYNTQQLLPTPLSTAHASTSSRRPRRTRRHASPSPAATPPLDMVRCDDACVPPSCTSSCDVDWRDAVVRDHATPCVHVVASSRSGGGGGDDTAAAAAVTARHASATPYSHYHDGGNTVIQSQTRVVAAAANNNNSNNSNNNEMTTATDACEPSRRRTPPDTPSVHVCIRPAPLHATGSKTTPSPATDTAGKTHNSNNNKQQPRQRQQPPQYGDRSSSYGRRRAVHDARAPHTPPLSVYCPPYHVLRQELQQLWAMARRARMFDDVLRVREMLFGAHCNSSIGITRHGLRCGHAGLHASTAHARECDHDDGHDDGHDDDNCTDGDGYGATWSSTASTRCRASPTLELDEVEYVYILQHTYRRSVCGSRVRYDVGKMVVVDGDRGVEVGVVRAVYTRDAYAQQLHMLSAMSLSLSSSGHDGEGGNNNNHNNNKSACGNGKCNDNNKRSSNGDKDDGVAVATAADAASLLPPSLRRRILHARVYREVTAREAEYHRTTLRCLQQRTLLYLRQLHRLCLFNACRVQHMFFLGCEFQADVQKLYVYYAVQQPVRFLELATHLNHIFRCRIWMHEVSASDYDSLCSMLRT